MNDPRFRGLVPIYAPGKEPLPPGITEDDRATYMQAMKYQALAGAAMESCAAKATIAAVGGFAIGGFFSLMTTSFSYEDPLLRQQYSAGVTQKASVVMKDMAKGVYSQGKTFAKIGALYSAAECVIEGYRAKNDIYNSASAGMVAGAILARNTGPKGAFYGGLAFAGFSSVIDLWLRKEPADDD